MTEELSADISAGPSSDALQDQPTAARDLEVKPQAEPESLPEKVSRSEAVKRAVDKVLDAPDGEEKPVAAKTDEKADSEAKSRDADHKDEKKDSDPADKAEKSAAEKPATGRESADPRQSEGRKGAEPPARFLPEARAKWANVPNEVKAEFHRVSGEYERELQEHRQYRDGLREYEDLAKQHNVTVKDTMARYVAADRALNADFGRGVAELAKSYGHSPVSTVAAVLRAYGVTPQQYAQQVMQDPQAHAVQQAQPRQPSPDQIADMAAQRAVQSLQQQIAAAQTQESVDRFAAEHPDFDSLKGQIAEVLKSGVIDSLFGAGLSAEQKLSQAYLIAGGSPSHQNPATAVSDHSTAPAARQVNPAGQKSIAGHPSGDAATKPVKLSRKAAIAKAMRDAGIA